MLLSSHRPPLRSYLKDRRKAPGAESGECLNSCPAPALGQVAGDRPPRAITHTLTVRHQRSVPRGAHPRRSGRQPDRRTWPSEPHPNGYSVPSLLSVLSGTSCPDSKGSLVRAGRARVHHDEPREGRGGLRRSGGGLLPGAGLAGIVQLWEWIPDDAAMVFQLLGRSRLHDDRHVLAGQPAVGAGLAGEVCGHASRPSASLARLR